MKVTAKTEVRRLPQPSPWINTLVLGLWDNTCGPRIDQVGGLCFACGSTCCFWLTVNQVWHGQEQQTTDDQQQQLRDEELLNYAVCVVVVVVLLLLFVDCVL
jgi:hypothetical protein